MTFLRALALAALLGGSPAAEAQTAQGNTAPGSLAEASSFFKAPPLDGCRISIDDLIKGGSQALRGQWIVQKGPGEISLNTGGRIEMVPLPQRTGDVLRLGFRGGRLVADSAALGFLPVGVEDRAPLKPGTGLRADSAGRGDLAEGTEVFLDELALGALPCGADQLLRLNLLAERDSGTGEVLRQDIRLFLVDQGRMSGTYRETGPGGRLERGLITLLRR
ncbi:hypothetical protein K3725_06345 [Leisingera sp. S132]|uniref:hypothetical protein n=1 Tax=Leisingera sp. S132 TaxID=2867016 RepID=UPI0021A85AA8|nr:hypothetical protein [Leisingera sp. S132]UWQ80619.1 hypothetical protein K3725_06345 [Leisingera sp. S132]